MIANLALAVILAMRGQATLFPPVPQNPAVDVVGWHGWSYLQGAQPTWPKEYETIGDWTDIQSKFVALKPGKPSPWHLKVVIFTRTELDGRDARGVLREQRGTIESVQLAEIRTALLRFGAYVAAATNGAINIVADVQTETEWMRDSASGAFGADFAERYLTPRINGGSYEAEDKQFRGPFNSVLLVLPGASPTEIPDTVVNETPVATISALPLRSDAMPMSFDKAIRQAWKRQLDVRAKDLGYKGITISAGPDSQDAWATVASLDEPSTQAYLSHLTSVLDLHTSSDEPGDAKLSVLPATNVKLGPDPDRGQVLRLVESAGNRDGGMVLPARADGKPLATIAANPTFSVQVKSQAKDPIAVRLDSSDGKSVWISIGGDPMLLAPRPNTQVVSASFVPDGKWQNVAVDLRPVAKLTGVSDVVRMEIEPTPNAKLAGRLQPELIDYSFDDFKFSSEPGGSVVAAPEASATSTDPEARALFAAQAKGASTDLAALLKDKSELVRLNATSAYINFKDPTVEDALIANSLDLDPSVAAAALAALNADGSDTARAVVKRSVSVSLSDYAKMTAGKLLGDSKDPKVAETISFLIAARSWQAHVGAVQALAEINTPESQTFRLGFIGMSDPAVKLAVTLNADPSLDRVASSLLWSAVNEPSDAVRAASYVKLIESPSATNKAEGYKGVRDDSRYVRKLVIRYLAAHPSEDHRNALRTAIADRSAQVRTEALKGFAALEKGATLDEIGNVLDDNDPKVQLALIALSRKRGLKLPQKTLDSMHSSPDPAVVSAAKDLSS